MAMKVAELREELMAREEPVYIIFDVCDRNIAAAAMCHRRSEERRAQVEREERRELREERRRERRRERREERREEAEKQLKRLQSKLEKVTKKLTNSFHWSKVLGYVVIAQVVCNLSICRAHRLNTRYLVCMSAQLTCSATFSNVAVPSVPSSLIAVRQLAVSATGFVPTSHHYSQHINRGLRV